MLAPIMAQCFMQMKDYVHLSQAFCWATRRSGEVLLFWPLVKWLQGHLEFTKPCDGKKSSTIRLKQSWLS
jgi:hypothetical protein